MNNHVKFLVSKLIKRMRPAAIKGSRIHPTSVVEPFCDFVCSTMGKHSFCGYYCEISNCDIGAFCSIANCVTIGPGAHPMEWASTSPVFYRGRDSIKAKFAEHDRSAHKRTVIGSDVWIGTNVVVLQGVRIGTGAVVGAGSIVTRDVAAFDVVGGVPAKVIRKRFSQDTIDALVGSEWWNLSDDKIWKIAHLVTKPLEFARAATFL